MCVGHLEHSTLSFERPSTIQKWCVPKVHLLLTMEIPFPTKHHIHLTNTVIMPTLLYRLQLCRLRCTKCRPSNDSPNNPPSPRTRNYIRRRPRFTPPHTAPPPPQDEMTITKFKVTETPIKALAPQCKTQCTAQGMAA